MRGLIEAFRSGEDLHRFVGSRVFGVEPADVTPAMRSKGQGDVLRLAYGLGLRPVAAVDHSDRGARALMEEYFARFGGVRDYLGSIVQAARGTGHRDHAGPAALPARPDQR